MTPIEPSAEHRWLQRLLGDWTYEVEASMGPDQPPSIHTGTEHTRGVGALWIMSEGRSPMPEVGEAHTVMTLGYDTVKQRFVGTFIGSMMTHMWPYEGTLDVVTNILTLDSEGPSFADPMKYAKYQDIIEMRSDDHRILSSRYCDDQGNWHAFMTAHYRRVK